MKKITDERLQLVNLKNTRILFLVETLQILAIQIYTVITDGPEAAFHSPLMFVIFTIGALGGFLQMRVSADMEDSQKHRRKPMPYYGLFLISLTIGASVSIVLLLTDPHHPAGALISGIIFFICFLAAFSVGYYIRKKRSRDHDDE